MFCSFSDKVEIPLYNFTSHSRETYTVNHKELQHFFVLN
jgi:hypothetical protein